MERPFSELMYYWEAVAGNIEGGKSVTFMFSLAYQVSSFWKRWSKTARKQPLLNSIGLSSNYISIGLHCKWGFSTIPVAQEGKVINFGYLNTADLAVIIAKCVLHRNGWVSLFITSVHFTCIQS